MFGNLQSKMFPAYFMVVSVSAATSVAAFAYLHPWKSASSVEKYQLGFLLSALGFNLSNLLVFTPMTIEVILLDPLLVFVSKLLIVNQNMWILVAKGCVNWV